MIITRSIWLALILTSILSSLSVSKSVVKQSDEVNTGDKKLENFIQQMNPPAAISFSTRVVSSLRETEKNTLDLIDESEVITRDSASRKILQRLISADSNKLKDEIRHLDTVEGLISGAVDRLLKVQSSVNTTLKEMIHNAQDLYKMTDHYLQILEKVSHRNLYHRKDKLLANIRQIKGAAVTAIAWKAERKSWPLESVLTEDQPHMYKIFEESIVLRSGKINAAHILNLYKIGSEFGNETAQFRMAVIQASSDEDLSQSVLNYYFSSLSGSVLSQISLGFKHLHGLGVPKSCQTASLYYMEAAKAAADVIEKRGHENVRDLERLSLGPSGPVSVHPSQNSVLGAYQSSAEQDMIDYFSHTADKGDVNAQFRLGQYYFHGIRGVEKNIPEAMNYFKQAAKNDDSMSFGMLGNIYLNNLVPEENSNTKDRYAKARVFFESAINAYEKSSTNSNLAGAGMGYNGLGILHLYGLGVDQDETKAAEYLSRAVEHDSLDGVYNLASLHMTGVGVRHIDYAKAIKLLSLAAKRSHALSMFKLGQMHLNGIGTRKSCETGVAYLKAVAEKSDDYLETLSVAKNLHSSLNAEQALQLYLIAAEMGSELAQNNAAFLLDKGVRNYFHISSKPEDEPHQQIEPSEPQHSPPVETSNKIVMAFFENILEIDHFLQNLFWSVVDPIGFSEMFSGVSNLISSSKPAQEQLQITGNPDALRLLYLAAEQGNVEARVKIGDYFYYNLLEANEKKPSFVPESLLKSLEIENTNFEIAAHHYKKAGESKNGQALFNLGFMYENGVGLPQDFHLAKRYYDDAKLSDADASFPVNLALIGLFAHRFTHFIVNGGSLQTLPGFAQVILTAIRKVYLLVAGVPDLEVKTAPSEVIVEKRESLHNPDMLLGLGKEEQNEDLFSSIESDTIVVVFLFGFLLFITWFRQHRAVQRRFIDSEED